MKVKIAESPEKSKASNNKQALSLFTEYAFLKVIIMRKKLLM